MENSSTVLILTLPQIIDAALGRPQLGIVSYGLLNNILQVICQQLHLQDLQLKYQGAVAEQLKKFWDPEATTEIPSVFGQSEKKRPAEGSTYGLSPDDRVVVVPTSDLEKRPTLTVAISQSTIDGMMRDIHQLQGEVAELRSLPSNNDIFNAVNTKPGQPSPIVDMYQMLTITKRVDAAEQAITKVATYVEDLTKYIQGDTQAFREIHETYDFKKVRPQYADRRINQGDSLYDYFNASTTDETDWDPTTDRETNYSVAGESVIGASPVGSATGGPTGGVAGSKILDGTLDETQSTQNMDEDDERPLAEETVAEQKLLARNLFAAPKSRRIEIDICDMPTRDAFKLVQIELKNLKRTTEELSQNALRPQPVPLEAGGTKLQQRQYKILVELEKRIGRCVAQINDMDTSFAVSYTGVTSRLADLEESMKLVYDKAINEVQKADFEEQLSQTVYTLNERVRGLEVGVIKLSDSVDQATEEVENIHNKMRDLLDEFEEIKAEKIGRKEFGEALAEKVDLCMVNRKVSHDQFNATCDDLSKGIEEALEKLIEQEDLWHSALREIQQEISGKLCKADLQPLETFVADKLKSLQHKMKALAKLKKDQEAAATKRKFLRDVQCISCDKDVVMRTHLDPTLHLPTAPALPAHKNIAPYLAYELDQLRKQQQQAQFGKNLHHFEAAMQDTKGTINRYCGGQHTITTPQQRVSRPGNFLDQWGPKAIQVDCTSSDCNLGNNSEGTKKKSIKMPLTVRSAIKTVHPEKDKEYRDSVSEGRGSS